MRYLVLGLLAWLSASSPILAEDFPNRSIRIVVPTGAGGITDVLARFVGTKLSQATGQTVVIDNRSSTGGIAGSDYVARSAPDGYTLLFAFPSHTINAALFTKLPYDTVGSFAPVTMVSSFPAVLEVTPKFPAETLRGVIELAKSTSYPLNYASLGNGSLAFLSAALFAQEAHVPLVQVPYKDVPQAAAALQSGDVDMFFDTPVTALPLMHAGNVRALGVTSERRLATMPDVPTIGEVIPGFTARGWNGVLAPSGTPDDVIERLNHLIVGILQTPDTQRELAAMGVQVIGDTPEQFGAAIKADIAKWSALIERLGIQPE